MTVAVLGLERGTRRRDLALAAAYLVGGLVLYSLTIYWQFTLVPWPEKPPELFLATLGATVVAIGLRRVATMASVLLGTVAALADLTLGGSLATMLAYTQVLFDGCVYGSERMWRWLLRTTIAATGIAALAGIAATRSWQGAQFAVLVALLGVLPVVSGISVRQYRDQAEAERARAEQTARLVELDRRQAVVAERNRMARELHDVVANHLSAVAIHATAALSVRDLDRSQVDHALQVIRENSVQGLAEMRQMIGLLRDPGTATTEPVPPTVAAAPAVRRLPVDWARFDETEAVRVGLAEVERLAGQARRAGLEVRLTTTGTARSLPVSVDLAAYRIVQESLTNALKHGAGSATVTIGYHPGRISLTVENPLPEPAGGPTQRTARPLPTGVVPDKVMAVTGTTARTGGTAHGSVPGAGAGLIGMRERATLLDGRFTAGPDRQYWRVHAELPTERSAG